MKDYATRCCLLHFRMLCPSSGLQSAPSTGASRETNPEGCRGYVVVDRVVLPIVMSTLQPVVLQLSPIVWLLQAGCSLFSSEQFCRGDNESQLWQKAMSTRKKAVHRGGGAALSISKISKGWARKD